MADIAKRPDRSEISKRVDRAEKFLQKGKTAEALEEFLAILLEDRENDSVRQMAADLCVSLNRTSEAVKLLSQLFDRQVSASDSSRASLTYKRLARLVNPTCEQKIRFAQLMEASSKKLALETYEAALSEQTRLGREQEALATLKAIVHLDGNEQNLLKLGELSAKLGDRKAAATAFAQIAELAGAAGRKSQPWYERAYTEDSSDPKVVLEYGSGLLEDGQIGAAIFVFEAMVHGGGATPEIRNAYARALLAANRLSDAEPVVWELFEQHPARAQQVLDLIAAMIDSQMDANAVRLAKKLEQFQRKRGERKTFVAQMQEIANKHRPSTHVLEFLGELFNSSNREADYSQTLLKLFDLYCQHENFAKAGECLDRAAEVDPYEPGHQKRLQILKGRIDENRYQVIASRFSSATSNEPEKKPEHSLGNAALQDLMLQAEILVQYGMRSKAIERLQRIQELFPHEEERNEDLQRLYLSAGMTPKYAGSAPLLPVEVLSTLPVSAPPPPAPTPASDMSSLTRVAEITRKLYKQSTASNVLITAVNEIGAQWKVTRCLAAMRKPGLPPTAVEEYCADHVRAADASALAKLVCFVHELAMARGSLSIADALASSDLQPVRDLIAELTATSLLALPLVDGAEHVGLLLLVESTARAWNMSDVVVVKTIAEQITIALNNVGLRRLVKNLSVTDEGSGLLNRASYLDLLQAEIRRALQQATPLTVLLLQFGKSAQLVKELGEQGLELLMQQTGKMISSNIRQNDLAFRYAPATLALVLGETAEKEALLALEKFRKLLSEIRVPGRDQAVMFSAGLAQAVLRQAYDPTDIVTELINRAEQALEAARGTPNKVTALPPSSAAAAVA
ncbi:MAG: tetratricopeptide repeat protein [Acidobacteria bacterium]|nr:tetratricopeptide repeat protein [Acidobacteriota bacterium]MBV9482038.1 tetratricopeptide repeat protein [Acidobacteriota bacterium]